MTPDGLIKALKRYLRESHQDERTLAARIGVNHHPFITGSHPFEARQKEDWLSRMFPQARRIPVSVFPEWRLSI
jgi:hypothetical protein